jgi:signal transduction histidine kinase/ActR/RegA family two-component response regulator
VFKTAGDERVSVEEMMDLNQELSILHAISQAVNQSVDLDEILNKSVDNIMEMIHVHRVCIDLLDEKNNDLVLAVQRGFPEKYLKTIRREKLGVGVSGKVALSGQSMFMEDYPRHPEAVAPAIEEGLKSMAVIPLRARDKIFGTLSVARREVSEIATFEKTLFDSIGQIISGAMERNSLYVENVKRLEELKTLYSISQEIASKLELKVILQKIMESAIKLLNADSGSLALWDNQKQSYGIAIVHRLPDSLIGKEIYPPWTGVIGEVIVRKSPVLWKDYESHLNRLEELNSYPIKEVVGVPLIVREMIIGTMVISSFDPEVHFEQKEVDLLYNFAHHAAVAIGNAKLYEDSLAKIRQLTTLYEIGKTLSSTLDLDDLFKKALELLKDRFGYAACGILLLDRTKEELYIKHVTGRSLEEAKGLRFKVGTDGIVGWVAKTGELAYAPDVSKDSRYIPADPAIKSEAAFPLKVRDQLFGVLNIESSKLYGFDDEDLKTLSSFASQMSISIENAQLFSDLKQTLQELRQAQDQVVQAEKLRAMGELASGVAHDFNNVLAVVLGNTQLLLHQLDHLGVEEIRQGLKVIECSSKDGAETIRRIQEFTGVRRDREFVSLSLNDIVTEVVNVTQPRWRDQTQKKGIQIELTTRFGEIPLIMGNPSEMREVLTNIIFNAVDAMARGGKLTIATQPHAEDWVEMRIEDTGIGMTEEVRKRVFDPFFTTKGVTNSGLGMSVSYGIIKRHGGEILIESEPGRGTKFIIHLPTGYEEQQPFANDTAASRETRRARILVIDDEDSVRDILSRMLKTKGHKVVVAPNGEEGIERFKAEPFDLVFTDLGMPKLSGWDVGKTIKGMNRKIPVAMITGWGVELDKEKLNESGIDLVISKPFNFDQVIDLVSEAMELKEKI